MPRSIFTWLLITVFCSSIVILVSLVYFSSFPLELELGTTLDDIVVADEKSSSVSPNVLDSIDQPDVDGLQHEQGLDLDCRSAFDSDNNASVAYRGVAWKAEIGCWLVGYHSDVKQVNITEKIHGKTCGNDCSSQGNCNHELGECRCFHGYSGELCTETQYLACNYEAAHNQPFGKWVWSMCPAHCDTKRAMCYCGEGTKYRNRPVAESCGFIINSSVTDWNKLDLDIFTTNGSLKGWCNVDPQEGFSGKVKFKQECIACSRTNNGHSGTFCEISVLSFCINQCSGHGYCRNGFCQCRDGWYGVDCSIPSVFSRIREQPQGLRPYPLDIPGNAHLGESIASLGVEVTRKRPRMYVYDLLPKFNSLLLEGRQFYYDCLNRFYDHRNATVWTDQLYGAQMAFYESILASPYRTFNAEEADYFFVPVLDSCIIRQANDAPHLNTENHKGLRSSLTLDLYKEAYDHIMQQYPYWNKSSGKDHIWFFSWDEGACYAPKEIRNSTMLVHWGNTNSKHNYSATSYWDDISPDRRGNHPCFDPKKDIVLPAWKLPVANSLRAKLWARPREQRKTLFYFNGHLGPAYENDRKDAKYSMGIREKVAEEFGSSPNKDGKLGRQLQHDVIVTPIRSENYHEELASSIFCGVFPGDGWSGRMEDSVLQGCIPVIIQDSICLPYENVLNYDSFAVRIAEDDIPNMVKTLRGFNETEIEFKLVNVQKIWQRFLYRDSILLEAQRQKSNFGHVADWAVEVSQLSGDDVFDTLIQVLQYKLYNDHWRKRQTHSKEESGLPNKCSN